MRKYDFESIIDRRGMDALAVDGLGKIPGFAPEPPKEGFDVIPMWVADMNFNAPAVLTEAIADRVRHPLFGYFMPRDEYFQKIIDWHRVRNGVEGMEPKHIGYENGVLGGLVAVLNAYMQSGDKVLVHRPTYVGFTGSITGAGYEIVHSDLYQDADGIWRMDFADMDRKIKENNIKIAVFCNPHNPCGRAWTHEEMEQAAEVYRQNDCIVISDEIWSDLLLFGNKHIPFQSLNDDARNRTVALYAPSKTFNLAGLIGSYHVIYNDEIRRNVRKTSAKSHYHSMNVLSMHALLGAYTEEGMEWADELKEVLSENVQFTCDYLEKNMPDFETTRPEATYMLFLDCEKWCKRTGKSMDDLLKAGWDVGVAWQDGRPFKEGYYIRLNLALPLSRIQEAFDRLQKYVY
ncbi:MAG: aminotransferase class I/II-fold pyridoxal phosphate-dependent enzyme [Mogibacterium sp.]|nr:aminotransferase class I/II-fold pyridoxal phosphate-dependent enzyme [Mogibacterium sp.]